MCFSSLSPFLFFPSRSLPIYLRIFSGFRTEEIWKVCFRLTAKTKQCVLTRKTRHDFNDGSHILSALPHCELLIGTGYHLHCFTLFQMRFCNRKLHLHHHCLSVWPCLALLRHTSRQDLMFWHVLICFDPTWNRLSTAWIHQSAFVVSCRLYKPTCPTCRVLVCRSRVVRVSLISLGLSSTDCGVISRSRSIWNQGRFAKTCHCETDRDIPRLSQPSLRVSPAPWRQTYQTSRHEWSLCKKVLRIIWKTIGREKCDVLIHAQHAQADQLISRRLTCLWYVVHFLQHDMSVLICCGEATLGQEMSSSRLRSHGLSAHST